MYILNVPGLNIHSELLVHVILVQERWPHSYIYLVQKVLGFSSNSEALVGKLAHQSNDIIIIVTGVRWGSLSHLPGSLPSLALPMNILEQSGAIKTHYYHYCSCYVIMV